MKKIGLKLNNYKKELEALNEEFQIIPDGRLAKRGRFYYHEINEKRIGITKNTELIRLLCRKKISSRPQKAIKW